jgi:hypothetical protein
MQQSKAPPEKSPTSDQGNKAQKPVLTMAMSEFLDFQADRFNDEVKFVLNIAAILCDKRESADSSITLNYLVVALIEVGRQARQGFLPARWLVQAMNTEQKTVYDDLYSGYYDGDVCLNMAQDKSLLQQASNRGLSHSMFEVIDLCLKKGPGISHLGDLLTAVFRSMDNAFELHEV